MFTDEQFELIKPFFPKPRKPEKIPLSNVSEYINVKLTDLYEQKKDWVHSDTQSQVENLKDDIEVKKHPEYILSREDYQKYFEWDNFYQGDLWNCYLLATLDGMTSWGMMEEIARKSIKIDRDSTWEIRSISYFLPLWAPIGQSMQVIVTRDELIAYDWLKQHRLAKLGMKDGLLGLMIAYGKKTTGKDIFDTHLLTDGDPSATINTLISGISVYNNDTWDENFQKWLENSLRSFDPSTDIYSVSMIITHPRDKDQSDIWNLRYGEHHELSGKWYEAHAFSVERVEKGADDTIQVIVSNPWNASQERAFSFSEFKKLAYSFSYATKKSFIATWAIDAQVLGYKTFTDVDDRSKKQVNVWEKVDKNSKDSDGFITWVVSSSIYPTSIAIPEAAWVIFHPKDQYTTSYKEWRLENGDQVRVYDHGSVERVIVYADWEQHTTIYPDGSVFLYETDSPQHAILYDTPSLQWNACKRQGLFDISSKPRLINGTQEYTRGGKVVERQNWFFDRETGNLLSGLTELYDQDTHHKTWELNGRYKWGSLVEWTVMEFNPDTGNKTREMSGRYRWGKMTEWKIVAFNSITGIKVAETEGVYDTDAFIAQWKYRVFNAVWWVDMIAEWLFTKWDLISGILIRNKNGSQITTRYLHGREIK